MNGGMYAYVFPACSGLVYVGQVSSLAASTSPAR